MSQHTVEIPEWALLTIATHGNMGSGEVPRMMQVWAEKECERLGLKEKLRKEREERYQDLKQRVSSLWGSDTVQKVEDATASLAKSILSLS